ncbi:hypothetical protein GCM10011273_10030 [Asticcacaulis endophyticus]|uniref:Uncharacterized protein n=1 Tax=Asticcacaulis endophyticus TaxID=1395890 RepID=A0A918PYF6_9CAUL|nr:hypothetical protein GCM10011273_10030 [Asticcacaulis endophyticus]
MRAQVKRFMGKCHKKLTASGGIEGLGDRDNPKAIGIGLDHGTRHGVRGLLFQARVIIGQRRKIYAKAASGTR